MAKHCTQVVISGIKRFCDLVKIRLVFQSRQGKKAVKVWHFNPDETQNMTLESMEEEILPLFPDIQARRLIIRIER